MSGEEAGEPTVFAQTDPDEGKERWMEIHTQRRRERWRDAALQKH